ncbi:gluconate 2-dehydrogenase subunit 3 family protein [Ketogulonicigenium vulgare]|uniref:gluconate 2-dehydrogenase subunit 3 family protein n=1 Tax=Ketogulonicigenium vulgare TaxID=92945 RepID=UPI00235844AD|nr:gluconate 2-dehydrogenase subunit 3 family protein [Ketogulonicigenium vulgare]
MDRRSLLQMIAATTGMALIGSRVSAEPAQYPADMPTFALDDAQIATLDHLAEVIIPRTDTPGAMDAEVGAFMAVFVADCYSGTERTTFRNGIAAIERTATQRFGGAFVRLSDDQRRAIVTDLEVEAKAVGTAANPHFYTMMKQLTLLGFFTSRVGATEVLDYVAVPGMYEDVPLEPGQRAWAT